MGAEVDGLEEGAVQKEDGAVQKEVSGPEGGQRYRRRSGVQKEVRGPQKQIFKSTQMVGK